MGNADILTTTQASQRYGVPRRTLRAAIKRGSLAAIKPGHDYLLTPAALELWLPRWLGRKGSLAVERCRRERARQELNATRGGALLGESDD